MKVEIFHQFPGGQKFINKLKEALGNRKYTKLRVLVAYISWNGIRLVHKELEDFYDRGGKVSMILGIGGELSEPDVMRYLIERLPKAEIYLFYVPVKHFIFHPKLYILNDRISTLAFFGSNNFTVGGLFCNSESYIKSILDNRKDKIQSKEIEKIWDFYLKPCSPFKSKNLQKVDQKLINAYIKDKRKLPKVPKSPKPKFLEKIFPAVHIEKPPIVKASAQPRAKKGKKKTVLLLEILNETGAEGTQVQIPSKVIDEYFQVPNIGHQTIELKISKKPLRPAVICHFPNNTHRITFPELANIRRPLLMSFKKIKNSVYGIELFKGKQYKKFVRLCTNQTRSAARRWEILRA